MKGEHSLREYDFLRNNVINCENRIANETIYMFVTYFALLAFAFEHTVLFPITLIILIVFQSMINSDSLAIEKASAYILIFFEDHTDELHWATMHNDDAFVAKVNNINRNAGWYIKQYSSSILAVSTIISIFVDTLIKNDFDFMIDFISVLLCGLVIYINNKMHAHKCKDGNPLYAAVSIFYEQLGRTEKNDQ